MLWYLQHIGIDTSTAAFWCAERARQFALAVLPSSSARDRLAACTPIIDAKTAETVAEAAAAVRPSWAARSASEAAWAASVAMWAASVVWASEAAAWAAATAEAAARAGEAELSTIADYVRANYKLP